jgi:hypothetical protein
LDVLESGHGGFTSVQLCLTVASEATLPASVLGLYQVQRPQIGRLGRVRRGRVCHCLPVLHPRRSTLPPAMMRSAATGG